MTDRHARSGASTLPRDDASAFDPALAARDKSNDTNPDPDWCEDRRQAPVRIEVRPRPGLPDPMARKAAALLGLPGSSVSAGRVYYVGGGLTEAEAERIAAEFLADPLAEEYSVGPGHDISCDWAIEVGWRPGVTDNEGQVAAEVLSEAIGRPMEVHSARLYRFRGVPGNGKFGAAAAVALGNPLVERFRVSRPGAGEFAPDWSFAVKSPGAASRAQEAWAAADRPSRVWSPAAAAGDALEPIWPGDLVAVVDLPDDDAGLAEISRKGLLSLSVAEMRAVRQYIQDPGVAAERREAGLPPGSPTDVELEAIAQTWSEHCKHKIFNDAIRYRDENGERLIEQGLFKTFIRGATERIGRERDWLVSVFSDNAGVIRFDEDHHLVFKVETHNSPSALEPYGGALTGIVGVNRDPAGTGLGCRLLFNTDVFCLAPPAWPHPLPAGVLHPSRILGGVRKGVEDGGNQSGIPTVNGAVYFDPRFLGRPLVFCGTGGLMPREFGGKPAHRKEILPGDLVVMVGGRVGRDGIHGATFSSVRLESDTPLGVVQIGDPITQKRALDLLAEARECGLYRAITDNGAGGLSSSVGELAQLSGGCEIHLDAVPQKAIGLRPWEILVSESQERMTLAVPPECWDELARLASRRGVEVSRIGVFTDSGRFVCMWRGRQVARLSLSWLHEKGLPRRVLEAEWLPLDGPEPGHEDANGRAARPAAGNMRRRKTWTPGDGFDPGVLPGERKADAGDHTDALMALLGSLNICSREGLVRQYDHEVQGGSVVKPLVGRRADGPGDAAVLRPLLDSERAVAISNGLAIRHGDRDPYHMAINAVDEAIRNAVAVGADPDHLAILDNFCWPDPVHDPENNPDGRRKLGALVRACQGLYDAAVAYGTPLISGKDSMKNDFVGTVPVGSDAGMPSAPLGPGAASDALKLSVPPTLLVSAIGVVPDARAAITMDFKLPDDFIYVVGTTRDERGATEWARLTGFKGGHVPTVEPAQARRIYTALHQAIREHLVTACHDVSEGGLAVAIAECACAGELGAQVELDRAPGCAGLVPEAALFSESAGRLIVTVSPADCERFEAILKGLPVARVGRVTADPSVLVTNGGSKLIRASVADLKRSWQETPQW